MTPEYKIALLGFAFTVLALPCLLAARRQFQTGDDAMYAALDDDAPDYDAPAAPASPRRARWQGAVLAAVFASLAASIVLTLLAAAAPVATPAAASKTLRCPF